MRVVPPTQDEQLRAAFVMSGAGSTDFLGFVPCPRCKRSTRVERRVLHGKRVVVFAFHTTTIDSQKWCYKSESKVSAIDTLALLAGDFDG